VLDHIAASLEALGREVARLWRSEEAVPESLREIAERSALLRTTPLCPRF